MRKKKRSTKKNKIKYSKIETLAEYLARGGAIQHIDAVKIEDKGKAARSTVKTPAIPMDLTMGEHFFAERIKRHRKERKFTGDVSKLPLALVEFLKDKGKLPN